MMKTSLKSVHRISGIILSLFIGIHLLNHLTALAGPEVHIECTRMLRKVYRFWIVEALLMMAVITQICTGVWNILMRRGSRLNMWEKAQHISGLYLAFFLLLHVSAVMLGRGIQHLDTNFYFAAAGLNSFPYLLFFIPYYMCSVNAVFIHIGSVHFLKSRNKRWAQRVSILIIVVGLFCSILILTGFTGVEIPLIYKLP